MRRLLQLTLIALLLGLLPTTARADDRKGAARELATSGIELFHAGKPEQAFAQLEKAEALYPAVTHRVYLARSLVAMGRLVAAKKRYEAIAAEERPANAPKPVLEAYRTADKELAALKQRVPSVRIVVTAASEVTLDGAAVTPGAALDVDPGEHEVVAIVHGAAQVQRFTVSEGEVRDVTFERDTGDDLPDEETKGSAAEGSLVPAFAVFGVGAALLVVGTVTGSLSLAEVARIEEHCDEGHCRPEDEDEAAFASRLGTTSTITLALGGAAIATGIVLAIIRPGGESQDGGGAPPVSVRPLVGPAFVGLGGRF